MNFRNRFGRGLIVAGVGASLAILSVCAGAAITASAQSDPGEIPGQIVTDWDPGTSSTWTVGNSGTPWVADQFQVEDEGNNWTSYTLVNGAVPTDEQVSDLQDNLQYKLCSNYFDTQHVICSD